MRSRPGWVEPDVCFRIVHNAQVGQHRAPVAAYREQTIEISLEHKGVSKNGPVGSVTCRAPVDRIVSAVPPLRGDPKPPKEPKPRRVAELLKKAIEWQALLDAGKIASQADIARQEGITRARVTQVMGMLRLVPEIQQTILAIPANVRRQKITERALRHITQIEDRGQQAELFDALMGRAQCQHTIFRDVR